MSAENAERWEPVPRWNGLYEVSSIGRIRTLPRTVRVRSRYHADGGYLREVPAKLRKTPPRGRYRQICLSGEGRRQVADVHVLVCEAFHGPKPEGHECAHNDGDTGNNVEGNLRWATPLENHADKRLHGTIQRGAQIRFAKLTQESVEAIRSRRSDRAADLAAEFGVNRVHIYAIWRGAVWAHLNGEKA